jgi:hypothetical protein
VNEEQLAARERAIAEKEAAFAEREAAAQRLADQAFVDGLVQAAQLPQGLAPRVVAFMAALDDKGEVSFAEGSATVKQTPREAFRGLLAALPKLAQFGEFAGGDGPGAGHGGNPVALAEFGTARLDPARAELHRKALAYQRAHPDTDYVTAVLAVEQAA